ncbi:hypothetical protein RJ639_002038 [Escallonia herrerae]|uniref:Uncharacterized protein n=1 Tax=Escallonia herrerae TaxID=1293975 RepID=A0AA88XFG3_9ASTE|nr:hypothetical protein RJ639_002038 [Escallonia herrerae]
MELGCDSVFVGSGVFKSGDPVRRGRTIVQAVHYSNLKVLAVVSCGTVVVVIPWDGSSSGFVGRWWRWHGHFGDGGVGIVVMVICGTMLVVILWDEIREVGGDGRY